MIPLERILEAARLIEPKINRTPLVHSPHLSALFGAEIHLKLENLQKTGAFKLRGAVNKMFSGRTRIGPLGVVAASAGNHAQGVALAASQAGIPAAIVMPEWASISKQTATRGFWRGGHNRRPKRGGEPGAGRGPGPGGPDLYPPL